MFGLFGKRANSLSMEEAKAEMEKDKNIVLLDVRTTDEFKQGHVKNSVNVPLHLVPVTLSKKVPNKNARIFVCCLSGARSSQAVRWMTQNGYDNVTDLGGLNAWRVPIVKG